MGGSTWPVCGDDPIGRRRSAAGPRRSRPRGARRAPLDELVGERHQRGPIASATVAWCERRRMLGSWFLRAVVSIAASWRSRCRSIWPVAGVRGIAPAQHPAGLLVGGQRLRGVGGDVGPQVVEGRAPGTPRPPPRRSRPSRSSGAPNTATSSIAGWVRKRLLDHLWSDRFAAGADHRADAADDRQVAVVVDLGPVAGVVPAVAGSRPAGGLGVTQVAVEQQRTRHQQLAVLGDRRPR